MNHFLQQKESLLNLKQLSKKAKILFLNDPKYVIHIEMENFCNALIDLLESKLITKFFYL